MATKESLFVYLHKKLIGQLVRKPNGAIEFTYNPKSKTPLSLSLPLTQSTYSGREVLNYFDNLLPDSKDIRERIAQNTQSKSVKAFDLLQNIGHECVGALEFHQSSDLVTEDKIDAKVITDSEIAEKIKNLKKFPLGIKNDEDFRISVAGMQEKTALLWHEEKWKTPFGSTPTTHILKPPMGEHLNGIDLSTSVENEWLCLNICRAFGLKTAEAQMHTFKDQKCLAVKRFDRLWEGKNLKRIHQEDICQALGIASHLKYEADHRKDLGNRPDVETILSLLNQSDKRRIDREQFFRSQVAFFILAATDGHAKNFSLFLTEKQFVMTPIYDVMSVYPALESGQIQKKQVKLAMSIGDNRHYKQKEITGRHFFQTAKKNGITKNTVEDIFNEIKNATEKIESTLNIPKGFPKKVSDPILNGIKKTVKNLEN